MPGPLTGFKIVEMGGMGPSTWGAMMLSDMGAEVIRVDRPSDCGVYSDENRQAEWGYLRGRRSVAIDIRTDAGREAVLRLLDSADAVIEGNRPGVMERLGLGPDICLERNPRLVYGRMTGWGQDGPMANAPGHEINYLALTGVLNAIGPEERPVLPLNIIADYGGGGLMLAFGVVAALLETSRSAKGQVIDTSMVEGSALLAALFYAAQQNGQYSLERESNSLDGAAPHYGVYETSDGKWVSVGAVEEKFYRLLIAELGIDSEELPSRDDPRSWPEIKKRIAAAFRTQTRDAWTERLQGLEVCYSPVLDFEEAMQHPQQVARDSFVPVGDQLQPGPAPRFSRTPGEVSMPPSFPGQQTRAVLADWGFDASEIAALIEGGAAAEHR